MKVRVEPRMQLKFLCGFFLFALVVPVISHSQTVGASPASSTEMAPGTDGPTANGKPHDASYIIGNDDVLAINVWQEKELSRSIPVRSDGKISLPLVGELLAAGKTPLQLEQEIAERLRSYITAPQVTVMVEQVNSRKYNILGEVTKPGAYPLAVPTTVMDAIATAGGLRDFAKKKGIYILRQNPNGSVRRITFNYKEFIKGKNPAQNVMLEPHDTVIVP